MSETMVTAFQTALGTVQGDVLQAIGVALPIALSVAGVIWVAKRLFRWFRGMTGGQ